MIKGVRIKHLLSSSLWITVLIVRVGCIIEAHASTVDVAMDHTNKDSKEDLSGSLLRQSGVKKKIISSRRLFTSSNLSSSTVKATTAMNELTEDSNPDDDTCSLKADGYFPNYGSDCTSYYFCAAGYQITYVCPPGSRFNENTKKCEEEAKCATKGHKNICNFLPNGYYTNQANNRKYFYCYNNAKVIDLMCDEGKIFDGNKCTFYQEVSPPVKGSTEVSCSGKPNGFYLILNTECTKYYFCIGGSKTELKCENGLVFNGDICVRPNRYKCPPPTHSHENSITHSSNSRSNHTITVSNVSNALRQPETADDKIYLTSESTAESLDSTSMSTTTTMF
ncbi:unnamed protein product [Allacma fusca]|uniref:Chitin-binding type-2 domain-containing protein n=1 Tax=Allacma fusca TaxID=39272 RepID=A0A8J2KF11_9HEXA|nr:unnamed protein product [Allacma fusca]